MQLTFQDLVLRIVDYLGADSSGEARGHAIRAAVEGYSFLATSFNWSCYYQRGRITCYAPYLTGTVAYLHSSGLVPYQVTLAGGTWPAWAADGTLLIGNVAYQVATRQSDTVLTLTASSNPGADLAAGTAYTLYQDAYPAPADYRQSDVMVAMDNACTMSYQHPREWLNRQRTKSGPARPRLYTVMAHWRNVAQLSFRLYPYPDSAYVFDFIYLRVPRPLVFVESKDGTVSCPATASVTGSATAFVAGMAGSVIRFAATPAAKSPAGPSGESPAAYERLVLSVESPTALTLDSALPASLAGVRYVITDPVDVEPAVMAQALYRECERQVRISRRMKENPEESAQYQLAVVTARASDRRHSGPEAVGRDSPYRERLARMPFNPNTE